MSGKKHVIVTGGAGFIGSHLTDRLIRDGYKVTVVDDLSTGNVQNLPSEVELIEADLGNENSYIELRKIEADAIFHLAGQSSGEASFLDPLSDLKSHVLSTFFLLELCRERGIKRFMYSSSMSVYGDPEVLPVNEGSPLQPKTYYAAAKCSAEAYIKFFQDRGLETSILRLFSVYGPRQNMTNKMQGMLSIYLSYLLEDRPIKVKGSIDRFRDLVYIDDLVDSWMTAFKEPVAIGKTYNVCSGTRTTVETLIQELKIASGKPDHTVDLLEGTPGDQFGMLGSHDTITADLGWAPKFDLESGIRATVRSFKQKKNPLEGELL